jgi:iron-sulfur cluster repair protein YtfE (RIC family)
MRLYPRMLLSDLLKARPAAVGWLNAAGLSFWDRWHSSCERFCRENGLKTETWLHLMENLPGLPDGSDPEEAPLYLLVDRLVAEHRLYREVDFPRIERILTDSARHEDPALTAALRAFKMFKRGFSAHLRREEGVLFPRVLWIEARVCAPRMPPGLRQPSFVGALRHGHDVENLLVGTARGIRARVAGSASANVKAIQHLIRDLELLEDKVSGHADLEITLFRRAAELEGMFSHSASFVHA